MKKLIAILKAVWAAIITLFAQAKPTPAEIQVAKQKTLRNRLRGKNKLYRRLLRRILWATMHPISHPRSRLTMVQRARQRERIKAYLRRLLPLELRFREALAAGGWSEARGFLVQINLLRRAYT